MPARRRRNVRLASRAFQPISQPFASSDMSLKHPSDKPDAARPESVEPVTLSDRVNAVINPTADPSPDAASQANGLTDELAHESRGRCRRNGRYRQSGRCQRAIVRNHRHLRSAQRHVLRALPSDPPRQTPASCANRADRQQIRRGSRTHARQNASHARSARPHVRQGRTDPVHALRNPAAIVLRRTVQTARRRRPHAIQHGAAGA